MRISQISLVFNSVCKDKAIIKHLTINYFPIIIQRQISIKKGYLYTPTHIHRHIDFVVYLI